MLIKEYRLTMPMTVNEYRIGQLYCVAEASRENVTGSEGIETIKNEPFENHPQLGEDFSSGQYTYKIYHFASKVPAFVRMMLPDRSMSVHEEAWNAFPYCKTVLWNPSLGQQTFSITIESMHLNDDGHTDNALHLPPHKLAKRDVVFIDIAKDSVDPRDYLEEEDPTLYHSEKTNRGPLSQNWREKDKPIMTCYKVCTVEFQWYGLQTRVESWIQSAEQKLFLRFHRKIFCTLDKWCEMNIEDIRIMEERIKREVESILTKRGNSLIE